MTGEFAFFKIEPEGALAEGFWGAAVRLWDLGMML